MKIRKLSIHNLASIEDAVIDFDAKPLSDSDVFLITGKTGAGKSTILDAICLALFGQVPRLANTKIQGQTNDENSAKGMEVDDVRQIMRRQTVDAFVKLTFRGNNDIEYEAEWLVERAHKKLTGGIKDTERKLTNLRTGFQLTKKKEIDAEIQNAIGLGFQQFCRTTMLTQGDFTRFLNSADKEKAEILEKITGVDIYSKIGAKIFELKGEAEKNYNIVKQQLGDIRILTDEEVETKNAELSTLTEKQKELTMQRDNNLAKTKWLKERETIAQQIETDNIALDTASKQTETEEFKQKQNFVTQWNATIDARKLLDKADNATRAINEQQQTMNLLFDAFKQIKAGTLFQKHAIENIEKEIVALNDFINSEKSNASIYENSQTIIAETEKREGNNAKISAERKNIDTENNTIEKELEPQKKNAEEKCKQTVNSLKAKEAEYEQIDKILANTGLALLRQAKEANAGKLTAINIAVERLKSIENEKKRMADTQADINKRAAELERRKTEFSELEPKVSEAKVRFETAKEILETQRESIEKWAKSIRSKLRIGDTCPVCRQEIGMAIPHEDELDKFVAECAAKYKETENEYNTLVEKCNKQKADIELREAQLTKDKQLAANDTTLAKLTKSALEACKPCGIKSVSDETVTELNKIAKQIETEIDILTQKILDGEKLETKAKETQKDINALRISADMAKDDFDNIEKRISESRQKIAFSKKNICTAEGESAAAGSRLAQLITNEAWLNECKNSPQQFITNLKSKTSAYNTKLKQFDDKKAEKDRMVNENSHVIDTMTAVVTLMPQWRDKPVNEASSAEQLLTKANNLHAQVQSTKDQIVAAKNNKAEAQKELQEYLSDHTDMSSDLLQLLNTFKSEQISEVSKSINLIIKDIDDRRAKLSLLKSQYEKHLAERTDITETDTIASLSEAIQTLEKEQSIVEAQKTTVMSVLKQNDDNKHKFSELQAEKEQKEDTFRKWDRLNQLFGSANGDKFRRIALSYVLADLISSANKYMYTLTDRYTLRVEPGTYVICIEDAYQGCSSRVVSTISGGESFLVSLSLALALSDIGDRLAVDTLFIDEGFGTLSGEPLQNAVNTLRSLHSKAGRKVGIISHVEELKERIQVQIQVNQEGNSSSSTVNVIG